MIHKNYITCLGRINRNMDEEKSVQMLVIGTEHCDVLFLQANCQKIEKELKVPSVPVLFHIEGTFAVEHRIFVACRDGRIYQIKNGSVQEQIISIESKPLGLVRFEKSILVAGMDNTIQSFYLKGKKNFSL